MDGENLPQPKGVRALNLGTDSTLNMYAYRYINGILYDKIDGVKKNQLCI